MDHVPDFVDSTHLMEKGPALAERLARDGYLSRRRTPKRSSGACCRVKRCWGSTADS